MRNYIKTDQYIHWLSQIIAKAGRSFVQEKSDDSHTNLYFDYLGDRIVGRWIDTKEGKIILSLKLSTLQFEWLNSAYRVMASIPTRGKTIKALEMDIENHLMELGLHKDGFSDNLHFDIPNYPFKIDSIQSIPDQYLEEWKEIRNLANNLCKSLVDHLQIEGEIRIWPHHFDTGFYIMTNDGIGIGFGLAMSDNMVDGPYFYMTGNLATGTLEYQNLPEFSNGKWYLSEHWNGAVLPLSTLEDISKEQHKAIINDYLLKAVNWFLIQS